MSKSEINLSSSVTFKVELKGKGLAKKSKCFLCVLEQIDLGMGGFWEGSEIGIEEGKIN